MSNILKKEFRLPSPTSKKKRWYWTIKCPKCGKIEEKIYSNKFINLCTHCAKYGFTTNEFIEKATKIHNGKYLYTNTDYINKRNKVTITCKEHGDFSQRAGDHLQGYGCPKCAIKLHKVKLRLNDDIIKDRINIHNNLCFTNIVDDTVYFTCKYHGEQNVRRKAVTKEFNGCVECSRLKHQKQSIRSNLISKPAILYYVYLPEYNLYKLGCTIYELSTRLKDVVYKTIWVYNTTYEDAIEIEHYLHIKYQEYQYKHRLDLPGGGGTECYIKNICPNIPQDIDTLRASCK